ncbi:hypothetical protein [Paenibacillus sp. USDA918EY]|uniref:Uncharacterized protein n=1 Tax=Paenibacillus albilobatus TaxID=2716884 RepID=A0A920CCM6_9BACL|nr:hypothetical protein [Paenibacillus sp. USDA918EY]GIO31782.1 hypothetical protein J2TS6_29230 [Paenibacillus albilobatus]
MNTWESGNGLDLDFFKQIKSVPDLRATFSLYHNGGEIWISCIDILGADMQLIKE